MAELTLADFLNQAETGNLFSALERVQAGFADDPAANAGLFHALLREAYWKRKNLAAAVALATAGIHYGISRARLATTSSLALELRSQAKGMAYDLASFTWPGWDEPSISPTADQMALGLHAAKFNLQLAIELQKPADKMRNAHWLLGAQLLANISEGHMRQALGHFQRAIPAETDEQHLLFRGYVVLARRMLGEASATAEWDALLIALAGQNSEPAKSALAQLQGAQRVFLKSA